MEMESEGIKWRGNGLRWKYRVERTKVAKSYACHLLHLDVGRFTCPEASEPCHAYDMLGRPGAA